MNAIIDETARQRAAVLIVRPGQLLLLYRYKNGREYYIIPGGGLEPGESPEQAARREIEEETGLAVTLDRKLWEYNNQGHREHYFLATRFSGEIRLGGPELAELSPENLYRPEWIDLTGLKGLPLVPTAIKERIIRELAGEDSLK